MTSLTDIVRKSWKFIKSEKENLGVIAATMITTGIIISQGQYFISETKNFIQKENIAKKQNIEYNITAKGTIFNQKYVNNKKIGALQIKNEDDEFITVANPYKNGKESLILGGLLATYLLFVKKKQKINSPFIPEYDLKEKKLNNVFIRTGIIASLGYTASMAYKLDIESTILLGYSTSIAIPYLAEYFFRENIMRKKYELIKLNNKVKPEEKYNNKIYRYMYIKELQQKADLALKNKTDDVWDLTLKLIREFKELSPNERYYAYEHWNPLKRMCFFKDHLMTNLNPTYENNLKMILTGSRQFKQKYEIIIEDLLKTRYEKGIELMQLDFELTVDYEKRKEKGIKLYNELIKQKKIMNPNIETNNLVLLMNCGKLGLQYAIKKGEKKRIEQEIKQTTEISKLFYQDNEILIPEICVEFDNEDIDELNDQKMIWIMYVDAKKMSDVLIDINDYDEKVDLLKKIVKANAKTAFSGINEEKENLYNKIVNDIKQNNELKNCLDLQEISVLKEDINVCLKFANKFMLVYDRDGNPGNQLINKEKNKIILIDHEARKKSDISYMLIKAIEQDTILPYDEKGYEMRNILIDTHLLNLGININEDLKDIAKAHYYASIPIKALSYHKFSQNKKNTKKIRMNYLKSSEYSIDILFKHFKNLYSDCELEKLTQIRGFMNKISQKTI
jgi:hypothetical protein